MHCYIQLLSPVLRVIRLVNIYIRAWCRLGLITIDAYPSPMWNFDIRSILAE